jgi:hypothetical protein
MRARLPADVLLVDEAQVRLMDKRCRLQKVIGALVAHVTAGEPPQLVVHQWQEPGKRGLVAAAPVYEQARDIAVARHG